MNIKSFLKICYSNIFRINTKNCIILGEIQYFFNLNRGLDTIINKSYFFYLSIIG